MASRIARAALGAASKARLSPPGVRSMPITLATPTTQARHQSNVPQQPDPKEKAKSLLDSLPGSSLLSKTAILSAGTGLSIAAISNELYVVNEESIVLFSLLTVYWGIYQYGGPAYSEWAENQRNKIKGILNSAREDHTSAVKARIESVNNLSSIVQVTKDLFDVSKETARLEAQAYDMEQKTALAAEAKNVLDSWVRYEGQVKQRQQRELAQSVIAKVDEELKDPRVLKQILDQSVRDVERIVAKA